MAKQAKNHITQDRIQQFIENKQLSKEVLKNKDLSELIHEISTYHQELIFQNENLKEIQIALEKAENYYKTLLDEAPIIYVIYNESYEIQWYNDRLLELIKTNETIKRLDSLIVAENQDIFYFHVKEVLDKGFATDKIILNDREGRHYNFLIISNLQEDSQGLLIRSALMDQTEEEKSKKEILEQKNFLRTILDGLDYPFYVVNPWTYEIELYNQAMAQVMDDKKESIKCYQVSHGFDAPCGSDNHACPVKIVKETLKPAFVEHIHKDSKGNIKYVEVHGYPLFDPQGNLKSVIEYVIDITSRKNMEIDLKENQKKLQQFMHAIEQSASTIVMTDIKGRIYYANPSFEITTGYSVEEARGKNPRILKSGRTSEEAYKKLWETISSGNIWTGEFYNRKKDGSYYWESAKISPIKDSQGIITGYMAVKEDITEKKEALETLTYQKNAQAFLSKISSHMLKVDNHNFNKSILEILEEIQKFYHGISSYTLIYKNDPSSTNKIFVNDHSGSRLEETFDNYDYTLLEKYLEKNAMVQWLSTHEMPPYFPFSRIFNMEGLLGLVLVNIPSEDKSLGLLVIGMSSFVKTINSYDGYLLKTLGEVFAGVILRHHAAKKLFDNEKKLRSYINNAPDGVMVHNQEGKWIEVNPSATIITGYQASELLDKSIDDLFNQPVKWIEFFQEHPEGIFSLEEVIQKKSGVFTWLSVSMVQVSEGRYLGFYKDISERKKAYNGLLQREALLNASQALTHVGAWEWDLNTKKMFWTDEVYRIHGMIPGVLEPGSEEHIAQSMACYEEQDRQIIDEAFKRVQNLGEPYDLELRFKSRDGKSKWIRTTASAIFKNHQIHKIVGNIMDITTRKSFEEALKQSKAEAEKASAIKSEFLSNMSHEIRTPMNAILGMLNMALSTPLTYEQKNYLDMANRSAHNLIDIVNDVLDLSKIEAGLLDLEEISFDLDEVIKDVSGVIAASAYERGIHFYIQMTPEIMPPLVGDPLRLRQVLINFLGNAVKFTEEGFVRLSILSESQANKRMLVIKVKDTGIGMSSEEIDRLYEPFIQGNQTIARKYGGSGLGLSISKELINKMGGKMRVQSNIHEGSEFIIELNLNEDLSKKNYERVKKFHKRVIILYDDIKSYKILKSYLLACDVEVADQNINIDKNLDIKKLRNYDLVIVDFETAMKIDLSAVKLSNINILEIENYGQDNKRFSQEYLMKPFTFKSFYHMLDERFGFAKEKNNTPVNLLPLKDQNILLVDDYVINQKVGKLLLEKWGAKVVICDSGEEALSIIDQMAFDLILLDVQMPGMTGYDVARLIREIPGKNTTPLIAMTAYGSDFDRLKSQEAGMDDHIVKPIDPEKLIETLKPYLKEKVTLVTNDLDNPFTYLDVEKGLAQCLDDKKTYEEILDYVLNHHNKDHFKLVSYFDNNDYEQVLKLLHQFKSLSGNIGALSLKDQVESLESTIRNSNELPKEKASLIAIKDNFDHVLEEIKIYLNLES